ncbi:toxin-antitoxin system YwqK family antitoxin [Streptomyces uncialis]|uniref:toxin-antitoxin system YwqK family antitoxin n=1 Tax=Streptomyces uncialis TaxID=1048205 RepID=UPI00378A04A3
MIDIDGPDVDMDDGLRLFYKGEPYTGEVVEYLGDALVSQETYAEGRPNGRTRQWYEDGVLRAEGTHTGGRLKGEFKEWHPNGVLKCRQLNSENGMSVLEDDRWDEDGQQIQARRYSSHG